MSVPLLTDSLSPVCYGTGSFDLGNPFGGNHEARFAFPGGVILQFHDHDPIPSYIWVLALIAQLALFVWQR